MPRNSSGTFTLAQPPFVPNTIISSSAMNSDLSDIASGLTQSLATTGVSSMTGPIKAAAGSVLLPGYAFATDTNTGFYLIGADNIGWSAGGVIGASFNADKSVTWYGGATWAGDISFASSVSISSDVRIGGNVTIGGALGVVGSVNLNNSGVIITTLSVAINRYMEIAEVTTPASAAANSTRIYIGERSINNLSGIPFAIDEQGYNYPLNNANGQCKLTKSGTSLLLSPFGGNLLLINGVPQTVPNAGVSLAASNTAAVFVYIYAFMSGATMTLELSTIAPDIQVGTGVRIKAGNDSRTLVGAAFTDAAGAWADTNGKLWVLSYFNRVPKISRTVITASLATVTAGFVEVDSAMRNHFIAWNEVGNSTKIKSYLQINKVGAGGIEAASNHNIDGTTPLDGVFINLIGAGLNGQSINHSSVISLTEAADHYATIFARSDAANTIVCSIGASSQNSTYIYVETNG